MTTAANQTAETVAITANRSDQATYSHIIGPHEYCEMLHGHRYLDTADTAVLNLIVNNHELTPNGQVGKKVVELGCGPGRLTERLAEFGYFLDRYNTLVAVDHDPDFIAYAKGEQGDNKGACYVLADATTFDPNGPVDIYYSQGFHHHILVGQPTWTCLNNVFRNLKPGGCYVLSDEFLSEDGNDRQRKTVRWHCHVIDHALKHGRYALAVEEAKTLLDDLGVPGTKSYEQVDLILRRAARVEHTNHIYMLGMDTSEVDALIEQLPKLAKDKPMGNPAFDLSRGDHKISYKTLEQQARNAGLVVESKKEFGPLDLFGGFVVYVLRKPMPSESTPVVAAPPQ